MIATYLELAAKTILLKLPKKSIFTQEAAILARKMMWQSSNIKEAIWKYGVVEVNGKLVFAYEVSGDNKSAIFDDANIPSLLSLPYLQFIPQDNPVYQSTR